jgi:hypothetical protein
MAVFQMECMRNHCVCCREKAEKLDVQCAPKTTGYRRAARRTSRIDQCDRNRIRALELRKAA